MPEETKLGFGIAAAAPLEVIQAVAPEAEGLGYESVWVNYTPNASGLRALGEAAPRTERIHLGVGVIPLSARTPEQIAAEVQTENLPLDRLILGVGSGSSAKPLRAVRDGVRDLRATLPVQIAVAALGPQMSRLAGATSDAVLFNWLTPEHARQSAEWVRDGAESAGRRPPLLYAYVRAALGPRAAALLAHEGARYNTIPWYGAHFQRMGVAPSETGIAAQTAEELHAGIHPWAGIVDVVVIRALTVSDTVEQNLALLRGAVGG
ncbi:MAG TPA: LLM class flavin-dependent oxidoreductase [Chloroflexota bacterium]|nr:LLM class flavin-dependent oxidoreductase [Chloroflexota bacterium]